MGIGSVLAPLALAVSLAAGAAQGFSFDNIDGGQLDMGAWEGRPVLVVNTASRCGYTPQYEGLQALQDRYEAAGLVVLAVPSDDFRQELGSAAEVKEFCEVTYGLSLPMTDITPVKGADAHPFYQWVKAETGFQPRWNFNKVLIGADGTVQATFGAKTKPLSRAMTEAVEAALATP